MRHIPDVFRNPDDAPNTLRAMITLQNVATAISRFEFIDLLQSCPARNGGLQHRKFYFSTASRFRAYCPMELSGAIFTWEEYACTAMSVLLIFS